ncbi:MAG: apolipoprotein N-acyltransferase [Pseudomonadota bacterium]
MTTKVKSHGFTALGPVHESFARLRGWNAHIVAAFLGALGAFAFAPFHFSPILVLSFTGLIWMIDGARGSPKWGKAVFARGWAFGCGFFLISLHWTAFPFLVEPEKHAVFLFMPLILLPAGLGLIWGAGAAFAGSFWSASPSRIFVFAIFMSLAEYVRGHLFGGFPWNLPGTTWTPGAAISQVASLGGIYWLTLLTFFVMSAPAALVDTRESRVLGHRLLPIIAAVALLGSSWAWGARRLSEPTALYSQHVTLMDVGVPQREKWAPGNAEPILRRYLELLDSVEQADDDIVIWPESAVPLYLLQTPNALDAVSAFIGSRKLVVGTPRRQPIRSDEVGLDLTAAPALPNEIHYFNSLAVVDSTSSRSGPIALYDKHRLVPFGELPAVEIIPFGRLIEGILPGTLQQMVTQGFNPGPGPAVVYADGIPPFNAMVCYEALYPSIPRHRLARPRAEWMVVISNDSWFGVGMGPAQHYAQNRYRAIETGLPMARVATRGATAMVDGLGRELGHGEPAPGDPEGWTSSVIRLPMPAARAETYYFRHGDLIFALSIALFSVLAFFAWRR